MLTTAFLMLSGCGQNLPSYRPNLLHAASLSSGETDQAISELAVKASEQIRVEFGPADAPIWPLNLPEAVDMKKVIRSAGPVGRDENKVERGLFSKHCVQCHGTTGDGLGPAASLLAPYPRDFRRGSFKFKSTTLGKKPTHADLVRTLEKGLTGTAMPAFGTLNNSKEFAEDIDALAHYVRFLAIRGEVERRFLQALVNDEHAPTAIAEVTKKVVESWIASESQSESFLERDANLESDNEKHVSLVAFEKGKVLFESELTACAKCHGKAGDGQGISQDFDEWTKDWTIRAGIDPTKPSEWKPMKKFGALKPVIDRARNLTLGAYRGGTTKADIYRRIVLGVEGSPMPAVARKEGENPGLTEEDILALVDYVFSLSRPDSVPGVVHSSAIPSLGSIAEVKNVLDK